MTKRHLVLGGAGFVGSHLVDLIIKRDKSAKVLVLDKAIFGNNIDPETSSNKNFEMVEGDAEDFKLLSGILRSFKPSHVWHLAANSDISKSSESPRIDVDLTFGTTASLCLAIAESKYTLETLIFSSSSAIFGIQSALIDENSRKKPESSYGWMKLASEKLVFSLLHTHRVKKVFVARFPNVTGGRQTHGVVKDLVRKYFLLSEPWNILGDGNQAKPYIHVEDLTKILVDIQESPPAKDAFELNIAPADTISVRQIVEEIEIQGNLNREPHFGDSPGGWDGDVPKYSYDITHLAKLGVHAPSSKVAIKKSISDEISKYK